MYHDRALYTVSLKITSVSKSLLLVLVMSRVRKLKAEPPTAPAALLASECRVVHLARVLDTCILSLVCRPCPSR